LTHFIPLTIHIDILCHCLVYKLYNIYIYLLYYFYKLWPSYRFASTEHISFYSVTI